MLLLYKKLVSFDWIISFLQIKIFFCYNIKMKKILLLIITITFTYAQNLTKQLIVVTTPNFSSSSGVLQRYQKVGNKWQKVGKKLNIKVGKNGLAWGVGLHQIPKNATLIKKEGDGKAPAGIFKLGAAFGYNHFKTVYPYKVYKEYHHCVDDIKSKYYNHIVNSHKIKKDYSSFEHMKFSKNYYKYGIAVLHNHFGKDAIRGNGSCIFIHIKSIPTAGCTAIAKEQDIKELIKWLNPTLNPLLIQAPKTQIAKLLKEVI